MSEGRYIDGSYAAAHPGWHAEDADGKAAEVSSLLDALGWRPSSIVDVGCGTGDVLASLRATWGACPGALVGVDPFAPQGDVPGVTLARQVPTACFDLALCLDVAEHVPDPVGLLRELAVLAPRQVLRLPLDLSVLDVLRPRRALEHRRLEGHLHAWTRALALAVVQEAGLRVVARRYVRAHVAPRGVGALTDRVRRALVRVAPDATVDGLGGFSLLLATVADAAG